MIRLFAAVPVPLDIGETLAFRQTGIEQARWRTLDSLHVTLRFFGEVPEDVAEDLDGELSIVSTAPFDLALQGAGAFGDGDKLSAVWAGVVESPDLRRLAERCESAARRAGLRPVTRNFKPHVTLAYLSRPDPVEVGRWVQSNNLLHTEAFRVTWFSLYSSQLSPDGSRYRVERDYPLV
jgi:RNA 2',3'-cyclic 3'-phosphodiesterase